MTTNKPAYFDPLTALKTYLETYWGDYEPAIADAYNESTHNWHNTLFTIVIDENNPIVEPLKMLLETMPTESKSATTGWVRKEAKVKVTIYVRPISYTSTSLDAAKLLFNGLKFRLNALLNTAKYRTISQSVNDGNSSSTHYIDQVDLGTWDDGKSILRGFGVKGKPPYIEFSSNQTIKLIYYEATS